MRTITAIAADERRDGSALPSLQTRAARNPRRLPTLSNPRLPTPSTSRPRLDLELPQIPKGLSQSRSLSTLSLVANRRQEQLQVILNRSASLGQARLEEPTPAAADSGRAFREMSDEIGLLLSESVGVYGEETLESKAAAAKVREAAFLAANPEVAARKKKEEEEKAMKEKEETRKRRAAQLAEMLKKAGRGKSGHHEAVQRKLEELRTDNEARVEFEQYIHGLGAKQGTNVIERNIEKVRNVTTEDLLALQVERLQQQGAKRILKGVQVREEHQRRQAAEQTAIQADLQRRTADRQAMHKRAHVAEVQGRCTQWLTLLVVAHSAVEFRRFMVQGRTQDTEMRRKRAATLALQRRWRATLIPLRMKRLIQGLRVLRRRVFWWRIRQRITTKRKSLLILADFLRGCAESLVARRIKLFRYQAIKVQRAWRWIAVVLRAQLQMTLLAWEAHAQSALIGSERPPARPLCLLSGRLAAPYAEAACTYSSGCVRASTVLWPPLPE